MPLHLFKNRKDMRATFTRDDPDNLNSTFRAIVSTAYMVPVPGKDIALVSINSGGVHASILHLFPDIITASGTGNFLYRRPDGTMTDETIRLNHTSNCESGGPGFEYVLPFNTFTGLCMGTLVAKYAKSCIAGVHLRGIPQKPNGLALTLTKQELEATLLVAHSQWKGAFPAHSNGTFPTVRYGIPLVATEAIHEDSPINYMPKGSAIEFVGQTGNRVTFTKSKVRPTAISDAVELHTGVANKHGPPQFHRYKMWQASLAHSANPSAGVEGSLLTAAYEDYLKGLIAAFDEFDTDWVRQELIPLTDMQALCGVDGKRFLDAIKKSTAKGHPLTGPKEEWIEFLDPEDFPEFNCPAVAHDEVLAEVALLKTCLLKGERYYSIFKACVKDEPTVIGKDKVRVFQAADWATQLVIRQYFLPIARMMSLFPVASECAVGVNAQGPQ